MKVLYKVNLTAEELRRVFSLENVASRLVLLFFNIKGLEWEQWAFILSLFLPYFRDHVQDWNPYVFHLYRSSTLSNVVEVALVAINWMHDVTIILLIGDHVHHPTNFTPFMGLFFEEIAIPVKLPLKKIALRNDTCLYFVFSIRNDINLDRPIFLVFGKEEDLIAAVVSPL